MVVSRGRTSKYLGPLGKMYRKYRYVWFALSATSSKTKSRAPSGWTTWRWFLKPWSTASHEVLASRYLCAGRIWSGGARGRRRMGAGCLCDRRRIALFWLGLVDVLQERRTGCLFSAAPASRRFFSRRVRSVVFSWHGVQLRYARGTSAAGLRPDGPLCRGSSLLDSRRLAWFRLVRNVFRFLGQPLRHPPTPYL